MISCSAVCASGISKVKNVLTITPICMTALRLRRSESSEAPSPATATSRVGPKTSQRMSVAVRWSGPLASTISEPPSARS